MPASRPRMCSGMVWFHTVPRKTAETMSAAPGHREAHQRHPERRREAREGDARAVRRGRDDDGPAVVVDVRGPAAERGRDEGADGLRGVEQPQQLGALEDLGRQGREEHDRHREQHGGDVDEVGAEQVAPADRVAPALGDPAQARGRRLAAVGVGPHRGVQGAGDGQGDDVDDEAPADPHPGDEHAADRRARPARPTCMPKLDSALAAVIWSWRTVRGSSASRDGRCSDDVAASSAATPKISGRLGSARNELAASTAISTSWARPLPMSSLRRSTWSASAPPYRPKTISGTSSTRPTAPTRKLLPVRS